MTWEIIRITGVVALALLTIAVSLGIVGPAIRRPTARLTSVTAHLTATVGATFLVAAHVAFAIIDSYVDVPLSAAVVPGTSPWATIWIALGTIAVDLMIVMVVTSAMRQHAPALWWRAHVLAYPMYALVWIHTLAIGTDRAEPVMVGLAGVSAAMVAAAIVIRRSAAHRPVAVQPRKDLEEIAA